jgi:hypothetical protein
LKVQETGGTGKDETLHILICADDVNLLDEDVNTADINIETL